jgi:ABC-type nitrate/sulfonate/bicarbonate transport system substrate-binding protein
MVVAQEKGYFREEDLDVELILMTASVANMALLGETSTSSRAAPASFGAIARGAPLRFVFICFNRPMHWLYGKPEIKDVKGLKGKKIGVSAVGSSSSDSRARCARGTRRKVACPLYDSQSLFAIG